MKNLRAAREFCFQYFSHLQLPVFESLKKDLQSEGTPTLLTESLNSFKASTNTLLDDQANQFVQSQITSSLKNYIEIEKIITANLRNWKIGRLSKVDHTNLLLSVNDLCFSKSAPHKVVINEAVEISKKFGTLESSSFVNGVLDSIAKAQG